MDGFVDVQDLPTSVPVAPSALTLLGEISTALTVGLLYMEDDRGRERVAYALKLSELLWRATLNDICHPRRVS